MDIKWDLPPGTRGASEHLYQELRKAVLDGRLSAGSPIPSTRQLSAQLGIARQTVVDCYRKLITEGYLEARASAETVVSPSLPGMGVHNQHDINAILTPFGRSLANRNLMPRVPSIPLEIDFRAWRTAYDALPLDEWSRAVWNEVRQHSPRTLDTPDDRIGVPRLRRAIATVVAKERGIECTEENVTVLLGWKQAFDMICRLFVGEGDLIAVEEPTIANLLHFDLFGGGVVNIPVDEEGMQVAALENSPVKLVYVMPSHHFPTGVVLSLARRLQLLAWAEKQNAIIVEDDYDSEYRYTGAPIPSLKALDKRGRVLYIDTFTKSMYPSISLGFLISPPSLTKIVHNMRRFMCDPLPVQWEEAMASFIESGEFTRNGKRMRKLYAERRAALIAALNKHFRAKAVVSGDATGLHLFVRFDVGLTDAEMLKRAAAVGVGIDCAADCYAQAPPGGEFVFEFGNLAPGEIAEGIRRLAGAIL